jgi:cephalosporin-C deacetylase
VRVYDFNGHEGGGAHQQREQLAWVRALFAADQ